MTSRQSPTKPCQFNLPHVSQNQSPLLSSTATLYTSTLPVIAFDGLSSFYQVFFLLSNQRSIKRQRQSCCSPAENISITFHHPQDGIKLELFAWVKECLPNSHNPSFSMTSLLPVTTSMPSNLIFLLELAIYDLSVGLELKYNFFLEAFPTILCSESHGFPNPLIIAITTLCSIVAAITPLSPLSGCAL